MKIHLLIRPKYPKDRMRRNITIDRAGTWTQKEESFVHDTEEKIYEKLW